jgi:hypothetical protein
MAELQRSLKAIAADVAEGFVTVNPLYLKRFTESMCKALYEAIEQKQNAIRAEPFPTHDVLQIRKRNVRLQRLHSARMVIRNFAREKRFSLVK